MAGDIGGGSVCQAYGVALCSRSSIKPLSELLETFQRFMEKTDLTSGKKMEVTLIMSRNNWKLNDKTIDGKTIEFPAIPREH